jgi:hypothetical protein
MRDIVLVQRLHYLPLVSSRLWRTSIVPMHSMRAERGLQASTAHACQENGATPHADDEHACWRVKCCPEEPARCTTVYHEHAGELDLGHEHLGCNT